MNLDSRIQQLENTLKEQEPTQRAETNLDDIIRKLELDPDKVRATAKEKNQSRAEFIAAELGIAYPDFVRVLKLRAEGR